MLRPEMHSVHAVTSLNVYGFDVLDERDSISLFSQQVDTDSSETILNDFCCIFIENSKITRNQLMSHLVTPQTFMSLFSPVAKIRVEKQSGLKYIFGFLSRRIPYYGNGHRYT